MTTNPKRRTRRREEPETRRKEILNAAIVLSLENGYQNITRESVAASAHTSCALVTWYFQTMDNLKSEVMAQAIEKHIVPIVAQGLSMGDSQALNIGMLLKEKVLNHLKQS